jgi:hypothetical protein
MRVRDWGLVLLVSVAGGCQSPRSQEPPPGPPPSPATGLARCGGMGSPAGFENVLAGADTPFYTARTRQSLQIKPGVEVRSKVDKEGRVLALTMMARNNSVDISCACPGGCSSDPGPGHGCVIQYPPGGSDASCSGDCVTQGGCCFGCGFMAPR